MNKIKKIQEFVFKLFLGYSTLLLLLAFMLIFQTSGERYLNIEVLSWFLPYTLLLTCYATLLFIQQKLTKEDGRKTIFALTILTGIVSALCWLVVLFFLYSFSQLGGGSLYWNTRMFIFIFPPSIILVIFATCLGGYLFTKNKN